MGEFIIVTDQDCILNDQNMLKSHSSCYFLENKYNTAFINFPSSHPKIFIANHHQVIT